MTVSVSADRPDRRWWHASYALGDRICSAQRRREAILNARCKRQLDWIGRLPDWTPEKPYPAAPANDRE